MKRGKKTYFDYCFCGGARRKPQKQVKQVREKLEKAFNVWMLINQNAVIVLNIIELFYLFQSIAYSAFNKMNFKLKIIRKYSLKRLSCSYWTHSGSATALCKHEDILHCAAYKLGDRAIIDLWGSGCWLCSQFSDETHPGKDESLLERSSRELNWTKLRIFMLWVIRQKRNKNIEYAVVAIWIHG